MDGPMTKQGKQSAEKDLQKHQMFTLTHMKEAVNLSNVTFKNQKNTEIMTKKQETNNGYKADF